MKKVLALILAVLMLLPVLVACNGSGNGETTTKAPETSTPTPGATSGTITDTNTPTTGGNTPETTPPPASTAPAAPALPEVNYADTSFRVISTVDFSSATAWGNYEIVVADEALLVATELKESINKRNTNLKNSIGVTIEQISGGSSSNMYNTVGRSVARGNDEYDMVILRTKEAAQLAQKGYVASVQDDLTHISLHEEFYDEKAAQQLAVKGKNFFFISDITVLNVDATWLYYFNVDLIDEYDLENPYELLANDNWTIDKLLEMAEKATSDDGDNEWTKNDNWGIAGHGFVATAMFFGSGMHIAETQADGSIKLTMNDTRITDFMTKVTQLHPYWARYSIHGSGEPFGFVSGDNYGELTTMYAQGNTLFMGEVLAQSRDNSLGGGDEDMSIGMLPTPKLNKEQANYYTPVTSSVATVTCIPTTACGKDLVKASIIVEAWARESSETVMEVYIEQCQKSRYCKEPISAETIETIFDSIYYDIGDMFGWGSLTSELQKIIFDGDTDFASMYKQKAEAAETAIKEFLAAFKK